ncbi:Gldg family protein [Nostoc sp. FACHB-152]|uniref:GldG family protein n=1 Tax=unclassified Nostoc TaxID=2593658 RepID=UPI00168782D9|nr:MULTISPECIES: Gldg family protein [unclassified Nostoc]MBD2445693.1 Gldg family protein [Nostoc sp. FACHB-152]MBD2466807.1 Gldg family protein [Nostoc sp. FACHB-145]
MTKKTKKIAKKQLWQYLFWLGPFLLIAGVTAGLVAGSWGLIPLALIISGTVIIILWIVWQSQRNNWWGRRSTQAGTNALIATLSVILILGLINFLGSRYHVRADLTETQLFTLAPQSQAIVRGLQQPVKLWIFSPNPNTQDRELLEIYRRQNRNFEFEYVDPQARPGIAERFGVKDFGEVYLESGNKRQLVQTINENERLSEVRLTNRLQQITSSTTAKVYLLQGHGERPLNAVEGGMSQAVQALTDRNFTTAPLNLVESPKVPDDAASVIVAGPKRGLFDAEVKALQDYLNRGGNLLVMIDPATDPKLTSLLQQWGVRLDNRLAVDVSGTGVGLGPAAPIINEYGQHPITKDFGNGISFYRLARPIEITPVDGVQSTPLLRTKPYPNSWAESDLQSEKLEFNADKDLKGPLTLGVALSRKLPATNPTPAPLPTPTTQTPASPTPTAATTPAPLPTPTTQTPASPTPTAATTPAPLPTPTTQTQASPTPTAATTPAPLPTPTTQTQASPTPIAATTPTTQGQASPIPATAEKSATVAKESRLVVVGNSDFASNGLFEQQLNGDVFLNSVTWLSQQDQQPLSIRPKEVKNRRLNLSGIQASFLALTSLLFLPVIGFLAAGLVWWRRR